jgi:hypothetical protein
MDQVLQRPVGALHAAREGLVEALQDYRFGQPARTLSVASKRKGGFGRRGLCAVAGSEGVRARRPPGPGQRAGRQDTERGRGVRDPDPAVELSGAADEGEGTEGSNLRLGRSPPSPPVGPPDLPERRRPGRVHACAERDVGGTGPEERGGPGGGVEGAGTRVDRCHERALRDRRGGSSSPTARGGGGTQEGDSA